MKLIANAKNQFIAALTIVFVTEAPSLSYWNSLLLIVHVIVYYQPSNLPTNITTSDIITHWQTHVY